MLGALLIAATCSWANPAADPFMGSIPRAVDSYKDIPAEVRVALQQKMNQRKFDDIVVIKRDYIQGNHYAYSNLRDMHFGTNRMCREVSRKKWNSSMQERALVYCEKEYCVAVPTVCRNVSRVTKGAKVKTISSQPPGGPLGIGPVQPLLVPTEAGIVASVFIQPPEVGPIQFPSLLPPPPQTFSGQPILAFVPSTKGSPSPANPDWGFSQHTPPITSVRPDYYWHQGPIPPIPEPSTWVMMFVGILGAVFYKKFFSNRS